MATNAFVHLENTDDTQRLSDYTSVRVDLLCVLEYASELQKNGYNLGTDVEPLMIAAIIKYGRVFSGGIRRVSLYEQRYVVLAPQQIAFHERLMAIRDKHIAHSVNSYEESQPIARYWVERVEQEGISSIECQHTRVACLSTVEIESIIDLAKTWVQFVDTKIAEEEREILEIVRKIPIEQILKNAPKAPLSNVGTPDKRRKN